MAPDAQLLTKQLIVEALTIVGNTDNVRFNLQRGKIARIWGFSWSLFVIGTSNRDYSLFVRKTAGAERAETPPDVLWAAARSHIVAGASFMTASTPIQIMFPKPHRTSGLTVQQHCTINTNTESMLIIYYDIDDVQQGELVQRWEKSRQKKYDRRMLAP